LYLLELYPNAPLRETMARARWSQAPDDDAADMYLRAMAALDEAGYRQYEISNVARPGRESRHNLKYWTDGEWLGFGGGAHSTRPGVRTQNIASVTEYVGALEAGRTVTGERREMSPLERLEEALFTGLRLTRGLDVAAIEATYGVHVWDQFGRDLQSFVDAGLLIYDERALRLTRPGMLLAHEIMIVMIGEPVR
jgi:oxygen-independent coproporphyrinogen-3 oxidase